MNKIIFFIAAALLLTVTSLNASAKTIRVSVTDEGFSPSGLDEPVTINVGDTVVWSLKSANSHNIEDGDFEGHACSGEGLSYTFTAFGEKYSHTFTAPVDCYYRCNVHPPDMRGLIHVVGNPDASGTSKENCKDCKDKTPN